MNSGRIRRLARAGYTVMAVALWLVVVGVAVEVCARLYIHWIETHNELILATQGLAPIPAFPDVKRPEKPISPALNKAVPPFQAKGNPGEDSHCEYFSVSRGNAPDARAKWRDEFWKIPDTDKNASAILHDDLVIAFDNKNRIVEMFGDGMMKRYIRLFWDGPALGDARTARRTIMAAVGDVMKERKPKTQVLTESDAASGIPFYLSPNPETGQATTVYAFLAAKVAPDSEELPPDSPWEIPYFRYKKNLRDAKSRGWSLSTNNFGFRGEDVAVPKPAGTFRIVCVGGSTTEEGPNNQQTYPALLEQKLRAAFPGKSIEVVNAGVSGLSTRKQVARLADYFEMEPDLIVLYEGVNDASIDLPTLWHTLYLWPWEQLAAKSAFARRCLNGAFCPNRQQIQQDIQDLTIANLQAIHAAAMCRGIPVAICGIAAPSLDLLTSGELEFYDWDARTHWRNPLLSFSTYARTVERINEALRSFSERERILYIPVGEKMQGGRETFGDICHMSDAGIERKAEIVFQYLKDYVKLGMEAIVYRTDPSR